MAQTVQILRNSPPLALLPGSLSVELGSETKLWVGSGSGNRLLLSSNPIDVPVTGKFLPLVGGTLTGPLILSRDPQGALEAGTKQYIDAATTSIRNTYLPLTGGVLTGLLTLSGPPTVPLHAATKAYVDAIDAAIRGQYLPLTGGTLSGDLGISRATPQLILNKSASGQASYVYGTMANLRRWTVAFGDTTGETGGNAGSNFSIYRYTDAGNQLDVPLWISRSTGQVNITGVLSVGSGLSISGGTTMTGGLTVGGATTMTGILTVPAIIYSGSPAHNFAFSWDGANTTVWVDGVNTGIIGRITSVSAGNGLAGGGSSGVVTLAMSGSYSGNYNITGSLGVAYIGCGGNIDASGHINSSASMDAPYIHSSGNIDAASSIGAGGNINASGQTAGGSLYSRGGLQVDGGATVNVDFACLRNIFARNILYGNTDGVLNVGSHISPLNDGGFYCGLAAWAWAGVESYNFFQKSDPSLKRDIEPVPSGCLDLVNAIKPQRYKYNLEVDEDRTHWGFMADEVGEVMTKAGHRFDGARLADGSASLAYNEMTAVLWAAVQELTARVKTLETP
jgi:hypothetical protein